MKTESLPVMFLIGRSKRDAAYGVTAVFPTLPGSPGLMTCYTHTGQHSSCCKSWARGRDMRHATLAEYSELLSDLRAIGYENLKIVKRISQEMDETRHANECAA
jgi:hypothetical protein